MGFCLGEAAWLVEPAPFTDQNLIGPDHQGIWSRSNDSFGLEMSQGEGTVRSSLVFTLCGLFDGRFIDTGWLGFKNHLSSSQQ